MNDRDLIDLYSQRRQEYVAMRDRMRDMKRDLHKMLERGDLEGFRNTRFSADILSNDLRRVQDSMHYLESRVCVVLRKHRPEN